MPSKLSYTNRQNSTAYIRAVPAKKGGMRYYITKDPKSPDLIEEIPEDYEFYEYIHDGRIVFRKRKKSQIKPVERQIVEDAVANLSAATDFIVEALDKEIVVYISQFNSIGGQEENMTAEEARKAYGPSSDRWKKYYDYVRFILVSKKPRVFVAARVAFTGYFDHGYVELARSEDLEELAEKVCEHIGRDSYFDLLPEGVKREEK